MTNRRKKIWLLLCLSTLLTLEARGQITETKPTHDPALLGEVIEQIPKMQMYPCTDCHSGPADFNTTPRKLTQEHLEKKIHFGKNEPEKWCQTCHDEGNYLKMRLISGKEISFNQTYLLCGECHGDVYQNWLRNAHGKQVGFWNGPRQINACPACHDPHDPKFKPLKALKMPPPPVNNFWSL